MAEIVLDEKLREDLGSIERFCRYDGRVLRGYQRTVVEAIWDMLCGHGGRSLAVMLPRQSGKNELQAHLEAYLLMICHLSTDAEIIKIAPTWKPQSVNALRRLERVLRRNAVARALSWQREQNSSIRMGGARISFYSGQPGANIVGATASLLLSVDEAQHIGVGHYDTQIAPMAAAKNVARIFWGTAWTADTLLAREMRQAERNQDLTEKHGRRAFRAGAEEVGRESPAYAAFVAEQVRRLGREHPAVRTQYFSEEIDAAGGLFPAQILAGLNGEHAWQERPSAERLYAFLLDVGGEKSAEGTQGAEREHDATALVIVAVEAGRGAQPMYRVVHLREWSGVGQPALLAELEQLARLWKPRKLVVDATGLGQGLAAGLEPALPGRVERFTFTARSKSVLGWSFQGLAAAGRFLLPRGGGAPVERLREQMARCTKTVGSGPDQALRWSVPDGARAADGAPLHDDLLMAAALCTRLDGEPWPLGGAGGMVAPRDPLREIDSGF